MVEPVKIFQTVFVWELSRRNRRLPIQSSALGFITHRLYIALFVWLFLDVWNRLLLSHTHTFQTLEAAIPHPVLRILGRTNIRHCCWLLSTTYRISGVNCLPFCLLLFMDGLAVLVQSHTWWWSYTGISRLGNVYAAAAPRKVCLPVVCTPGIVNDLYLTQRCESSLPFFTNFSTVYAYLLAFEGAVYLASHTWLSPFIRVAVWWLK